MPDYYELSTLTPYIPVAMITPLERALLEAFNLSPKSLDDRLYYFSEEGVYAGTLDYSPQRFIEDASPLRELIHQSVFKDSAKSVKDDESVEVDLETTAISWTDVLQSILNRPENTDIRHFTLNQALTCSKMGPGSFGGAITRVTKDDVFYADTNGLSKMFDAGIDPHTAIDIRSAYIELWHSVENGLDNSMFFKMRETFRNLVQHS
jgi:hypothetical protein